MYCLVLYSNGKLVVDVSDLASSAVELDRKDKWLCLVWFLPNHGFEVRFGRLRDCGRMVAVFVGVAYQGGRCSGRFKIVGRVCALLFVRRISH
jgi:hypothetical protein